MVNSYFHITLAWASCPFARALVMTEEQQQPNASEL
jgi:hypothetical protein